MIGSIGKLRGAPSCAPHPLALITYLLPNLLIAAAITLTGPTNRQPVNYQALKVALTAILKTPLLMVIPSRLMIYMTPINQRSDGSDVCTVITKISNF